MVGTTGNTGLAGSVGVQGPVGDTGSSGRTGLDGVEGQTGNTGASGNLALHWLLLASTVFLQNVLCYLQWLSLGTRDNVLRRNVVNNAIRF